MIYLDNAATTPIAPEVLEAMRPYLELNYGNPASKHYHLAEVSRQAVSEARKHVAALINAEPKELIFTSSASESNNFIIKGVLDQRPGRHLITTVAEHSSTHGTAQYLESQGNRVTYLPIDSEGHISLDTFRNAIDQDTSLVSINWVNNELGTIAPVAEISTICTENKVPLHLDATQAVGKVSVDVKRLPADYISFAAHKIYGPKGVGACYISNSANIRRPTPLIHGGGQEDDLRAGTLAVHNIVGFGAAAKLTYEMLSSDIQHAKEMEQLFLAKIAESVPLARANSTAGNKVPGIISITIPGINNELLLRSMRNELALSTGSACSSTKPSRVLQGAGMSLDDVRSTLRVSIGRYNTAQDIAYAVTILAHRIRRLSIG